MSSLQFSQTLLYHLFQQLQLEIWWRKAINHIMTYICLLQKNLKLKYYFIKLLQTFLP